MDDIIFPSEGTAYYYYYYYEVHTAHGPSTRGGNVCVCVFVFVRVYYAYLHDDGRLTFPVGVEPDENALCSFVISSYYLVCDVYLREEFTEHTHTHTVSLRTEYHSRRCISLISPVPL